MNDILQKVMTFINENTYLLIIICVFLILVLIGYLIDNSVKSKRVRKDIKNKDQVPENIKNEIIKEAMNENKEKMMENSFHNAVREESDNVKEEENLENIKDDSEKNINMELNLDEVSESENLNTSFDLNSTDISVPFSLDSSSSDIEVNDSVFNEPLVLDSEEKNVEEGFNSISSVDTMTTVDLNYNDPDTYLINQKSENIKYKNDKRLSEILLDVDKTRVSNMNKENTTLFEDSMLNIDVNTDIEKSKVEIENDNSSDELDKIMKKLSTMNSDDEDSYTNIF